MLNLIWFTWLMNQFFLTIILLNFLIAILAESFNVVMAEEMQHTYKQRVTLNKDTFLVMHTFNMLPAFDGFLLSAQTPPPKDPEAIDEAKKEIQATQQDIKDKMSLMKEDIILIKNLL